MSTATAATARDDRESSAFLEGVSEWFGRILEPAIQIVKLFPDSVLFGSFLLYAITQNLSYGVFSLFMFETSVLHQFASFTVKQTFGDSLQSSSSKEEGCVAGFRNPRLAMDRLKSARPQSLSPFVFYVGAVVVYLCAAIAQFKESLDVMGPDWSGRYYFVVIMTPILAAAMIILYGWSGCYSWQGALVAAGAGCIAGGALYLLNKTLFGAEGMNFLGLPYLVDKATIGEPIYICSATAITPPNQ